MSKKKNEAGHAVERKISPPKPVMQSQYRIVVSNQGKDAVKVDDRIRSDEIRIVSSEKINKEIQSDWVEEWDGVVEISTGVSAEVEEEMGKKVCKENESNH